MSSDVDKGTAALLVFFQKYTPCRNEAAPYRKRLCVIDVTELTAVGGSLKIESVVSLTVLIADSQLSAGTLCGVQHFLSLGGVNSHRLFAHNILAGFKRVNGDEAVRTVGRADVNHVDGLIAEQLPVIGVYLCVGSTVLFAGSLCALLDYVAESDHINLGNGLKTEKMLAVCDTAAADDTDSDFVVCSDCHVFSSGI